ncbi:MAG: hypothetical protein ACP5PN_09270 [Steroidobacteraceae bacterium]
MQRWLAKRPPLQVHCTPTCVSWLNRVERFLRAITTERLPRGVFTSVPEWLAAIDERSSHHSIHPKPLIWTRSARDILQKRIGANGRLSSKQNEAPHSRSVGEHRVRRQAEAAAHTAGARRLSARLQGPRGLRQRSSVLRNRSEAADFPGELRSLRTPMGDGRRPGSRRNQLF